MRVAVLTVIASCAPGCTLVFPLEDVLDKVPHIRALDGEEPGVGTFAPERSVEYDSSNVTQSLSGAQFERLRQDTDEIADVVVMRVDTFTLDAGVVFTITGDTPFLILARTVEIGGTIDASAANDGVRTGPGGGRAGLHEPGEGGAGIIGVTAINTGGGGGGFGTSGGAGGAATCTVEIPGGAGGPPHGDDELRVLRGGGAGGSGAARCNVTYRGGLGGGALQISATESITIKPTGIIRASGGGGGFGSGACNLMDDAGSGGGAGGAIYLDAPQFTNDGVIEAHGGGGGGGGDDTLQGGSGQDGVTGHWGNEGFPVLPETIEILPSLGGAGRPDKGTGGGNGARRDQSATAGLVGECGAQMIFNTGGGGGGFGRIVVRVDGGVIPPTGTITPPPTLLIYPVL